MFGWYSYISVTSNSQLQNCVSDQETTLQKSLVVYETFE